MKKVRLTDSNVRRLGRTCYFQDALWMAWSASGVAFTFQGKQLKAVFLGDQIAGRYPEKQVRIGVFVNGERKQDFMVNALRMEVNLLEGVDLEENSSLVLRIVKLSEAAESTVGLEYLEMDEEAVITPAPPKSKRIEFVGDSITCGYGVDGTLENTFSTRNEDATASYAYLTAKRLAANYSLVSISGHGVISGYTETGIKNEEQLVMPYYRTLGKSVGRFAGIQDPGEILWDFSQFVPDLIVINLGTNDTSYCQTDVARCQEYGRAYIEMLKEIRSCNPESEILCVLGIMYQTLYETIVQAVAAYSAETGDQRVSTFQLPLQRETDGYAVDWHPSKLTHQKEAALLSEYIRQYCPAFQR